jgi:hypothetical protein
MSQLLQLPLRQNGEGRQIAEKSSSKAMGCTGSTDGHAQSASVKLAIHVLPVRCPTLGFNHIRGREVLRLELVLVGLPIFG